MSLIWRGESFYGRTAELHRISELFAAGERLVTLTGFGGVGKTRLAARWAEQREDVVFAELALCTTSDDIVFALASALSAEGSATVEDVLRHRKGVVVLDNAEHVADIVTQLLERWLSDTHTSFLVTSRHRLRLSAERVIEVGPLAIDSEALQLFVDRARAARGSTVTDIATVSEIVTLLDGLPLAIELAAAHVRDMGLLDIRDLIAEDPELLEDELRDTRRRTLREMLEVSWRLLDTAEQTTLAECSVFANGFDIAAVRGVVTTPHALHVLRSLHDKSMVRLHGERHARGTMFESIRLYAAKQLAVLDPNEACAERHARWFAKEGLERARAYLRTGNVEAMEWIRTEEANLVAASRTGARRELFDVVGSASVALSMRCIVDGPPSRVRSIVDGACALPMDKKLHAMLLRIRAAALVQQGDIERARQDDADAAEHADHETLCYLGLNRAFIAVQSKGADAAELLERVRLAKNPPPRVVVLYHAYAALHAGNLGDHEGMLEKMGVAARTAHEIGDELVHSYALWGRGVALHELGKLDLARSTFLEALEVARGAHRVQRVLGYIHGDLANLADESGDIAAARFHAREARLAYESVGQRSLAALSECLEAFHTDDPPDAIEQTFSKLEVDIQPQHAVLLKWSRARLEVRRALAAGDAETKSKLLARASATQGSTDLSSTERYAKRVLNARIESARSPRLVIGPDGRWFDFEGARADLHRFPLLRRLLLTLADKRRESPGVPIPKHGLIQAMWVGEKIAVSAASTRLQTAVFRLRGLGLRDVIITEGDAYMLDPRIEIACGSETNR